MKTGRHGIALAPLATIALIALGVQVRADEKIVESYNLPGASMDQENYIPPLLVMVTADPSKVSSKNAVPRSSALIFSSPNARMSTGTPRKPPGGPIITIEYSSCTGPTLTSASPLAVNAFAEINKKAMDSLLL